jgi:hypothetical protein
MRRLLLAVLSSATLLCGSHRALAGVELEEIAKVKVVKALAGMVRGPGDEPIDSATVEEVSADQKTVFRRVLTDKDGKFNLPSVSGQKIYHLMISAPQFNTLLVHVRISRWTGKLLDLRIEVST